MTKLTHDNQAPAKGQFVIIYQAEEGELEPARTIKEFLTAHQEGQLI